MLKNMLAKKELTIYAGTSEKRFLPYSLLFDVLIHLNDEHLENKICTAFSTLLPQRRNYKNDIDLWVDLECCGDITYLMAGALAKILAQYLQEHAIYIYLVINNRDVLARDNKILLSYLQKLSPLVSVEFNYYQGFSVLFNHEKRYLKWPCFTPLKNFDFGAEFNNILFYAWRCAELGAESVGFKLLELGMKKSVSHFLRQLCLVQLQLMRIATQYYFEAANETRTVSEKYPQLLKSFCLSKAWGNILIRRLPTAKRYFDYAGVSMTNFPRDLDSMYKMNIYALYQFLSGAPNNAIELEEKIKTAIQNSSQNQKQITYINSINLARLHRSIGNLALSKQHYDLAFKMRSKVSETDYIYYSVCYGLLYEKQQSWAEALNYWLEASLHWLSAEYPEALGWRAIRSIAAYQFVPRGSLDIKLIDEALQKKLIYLITQNDLVIENNFVPFGFVSTPQPLSSVQFKLIDTEVSLAHMQPQSHSRKSKKPLEMLVAGILKAKFTLPCKNQNTFIIYRPGLNHDTSTIAE